MKLSTQFRRLAFPTAPNPSGLNDDELNRAIVDAIDWNPTVGRGDLEGHVMFSAGYGQDALLSKLYHYLGRAEKLYDYNPRSKGPHRGPDRPHEEFEGFGGWGGGPGPG